jgi:drug/metabolite transporter (DMT)-like permease
MPMQESTKHGIATFFKIINIVTFAIVSLIWKLKLDNISVEQQYFLQAFAASVTLFVIMILFPVSGNSSRFERTKAKFKVHSLKSYFLRAIVNAIGVPAMMQALKLTGANEVMTITQLSPVFTAILAVILLKEKIRMNWIIALFLGLCGVIVMIYGGGFKGPLEISPNYVSGILLAVIAAISFSVYNIICKKQHQIILLKLHHFLIQALIQ